MTNALRDCFNRSSRIGTTGVDGSVDAAVTGRAPTIDEMIVIMARGPNRSHRNPR